MNKSFNLFSGISLVFGIVCATMGVASLSLFGSPYEMLHILYGMSLLPPIWVFNLISVALYFLIGCAAGCIVYTTQRRQNAGQCEMAAYKGGLFFISCLFLSLIRHYIFFFSGKLFPALILSLACMICSISCAIVWGNARPKISSGIMFIFSIWQFYLFFVNLSVFLIN